MKKPVSILLGAIGLALFSAFWIYLRQSHPDIAAENGPMENFEVTCLSIGIVLFVSAGLRRPDRAEKIFFGGLALFYFTMLMSELDFRQYDAPFLNRVTKGVIRNTVLGLSWGVALAAFFRNRNPVWDCFLFWLRGRASLPMFVAGGFWLVSGLIDKSILPPKSLFNEELMEVNATLLMMVSAFLTVAHFQKAARPVETLAVRS